ncbi:MAG: phosphate ABC transporter permease PstA [Planctomycetes bacterium]|nr:phosphate ABC transporter permease PstA [Planctomycetota bacterium]
MKLGEIVDPSLARRRRKATAFRLLCTGMTAVSLILLVTLIVHVTREGIGSLSWQFLSSLPSYQPERAGIKTALFGTLWLIALTGFIAVPVGVAAAVYLEEYARPGRLNTLIEVNLSNLAGVPSIVYGILGLALFVRGVALGESVLAGALTMSLLILPVIIMASREAIRAVPPSIRQAAFALGATRWETVRHHVVPSALPGIITGIILALSRAIGETAPLVMIGALTYVPFVPRGPMDSFTALPIQIYNWASKPQQEFHLLAAAGIIVLLAVLLVMNGTAVYIRQRSRKGQ